MRIGRICKKQRRIMLCVLVAANFFTACGAYQVTEVVDTQELEETTEEPAGKVGVLMPSKTEERWEKDAENITKTLESYGYEVTVEFAVNNAYIQVRQLEELLEQQVDCLVISAVDPGMLSQCLKEAKEQGVSIISYDRLLMNTEAVSYYATFDNRNIGIAMGSYIKEKEELEQVRKKGEHRTIEFFMGSPDDNNARLVYEGIMEVLQEYLEDGTLVCNSGRTQFTDTSVMRWSEYLAQKEAVYTLRADYSEEKLDIACCANDNICAGIITALEQEGYTAADWPLLTGQDAGVAAVKRIMAGKQTMSVYKDTRALADKCASMVRACIEGSRPEINNKNDFDNGVIRVPTYLCTTIVVDKSNYKEILIDGGYYTTSQLESDTSR